MIDMPHFVVQLIDCDQVRCNIGCQVWEIRCSSWVCDAVQPTDHGDPSDDLRLWFWGANLTGPAFEMDNMA
jgi:hypothetical protein